MGVSCVNWDAVVLPLLLLQWSGIGLFPVSCFGMQCLPLLNDNLLGVVLKGLTTVK